MPPLFGVDNKPAAKDASGRTIISDMVQCAALRRKYQLLVREAKSSGETPISFREFLRMEGVSPESCGGTP